LYYQYALANKWQDPNIVAITPFLLNAVDGPFVQFSFRKKDGQFVESAAVLGSYSTIGKPALSPLSITVPTAQSSPATESASHPTEDSSQTLLAKLYNSFMSIIKIFGK
jgi:hypothetical protein